MALIIGCLGYLCGRRGVSRARHWMTRLASQSPHLTPPIRGGPLAPGVVGRLGRELHALVAVVIG